MDFEYTPEQETFRQEVRRWLEANITPDLCVDDAMDERVAGDRETFERRVAWQKKLNAAGWVGLSWPKQYGGRGVTLMEQIIFNEEYGRVRAPVLPGYMGVSLAGPTLMQAEAEAEACFLKAIEIAQKQQAKSLELRAVMSLALLWQSQGKTAEAHDMLSTIYNWFTEGFDTRDLQEAKALLEALQPDV